MNLADAIRKASGRSAPEEAVVQPWQSFAAMHEPKVASDRLPRSPKRCSMHSQRLLRSRKLCLSKRLSKKLLQSKQALTFLSRQS